MHHYNFPPFSVGEAKPLRGTGRREVGHGALAEKALIPVLPSKDDFPYTVRVVSETLGSNGSSSMASTCASSLSLMDAGVPIKTAVAGIAIGLASNKDMSKWKILTDIQDLEDGEGGMDFKITGTKDGITAIQLDTKTDGLNKDIIHEAMKAGRIALDKILVNMNKAISEPNPELSPYAPKLLNLRIKPEKIGMVIGPGGKMINKIIDLTECQIDIEEDGLVVITGQDIEKLREAEAMIKEIVHEFEPGEIVEGEVVNIMDFGAFVKLNKNQDGLVHISELAPYRVNKTDDIVKIGDAVKVKVKEVDDNGKVKLSMKEVPENEKYWSKGQVNHNNSSDNQNNAKF
jgi:polyribonucleotide nucleotidyltransferase